MELSYKFMSAMFERFDWQWCGSYGEPGYGSWRTDTDTTAVVLGDYWLRSEQRYGNNDTHPERGTMRRDPYNDGTTLRDMEARYPRLWAQLESQGVCFEWYDEWAIDYESDKAYRTTADSYGWESSIAWTEGGDMLTPDTDISEWLEYAINESDRCLTDNMVGESVAAALTGEGFTRYDIESGHDHHFANGWNPGQTDTPDAVTEMIRRHLGDVEIVFCIDGVGQFDVHFGAYTRPVETDEMTDWYQDEMDRDDGIID